MRKLNKSSHSPMARCLTAPRSQHNSTCRCKMKIARAKCVDLACHQVTCPQVDEVGFRLSIDRSSIVGTAVDLTIDHGAGLDGGGPGGSAVDAIDGAAAAPVVDPMSSSSSSRRFPSGMTIESLKLIMLKSLETPLVDPAPLDPLEGA